jgi:aspartate aminotransferase-like enzyme
MLQQACGATPDHRVMMLTGSGTAGMEAAVLNLFAPGERVLVVNSGDFGQRFVELAELHQLAVTEVKLGPGEQLTEEDLWPHDHGGFAGLLMNHHETSTGSLHDLTVVAQFCRGRKLLLVVDAISSFLADHLAVAATGIDALILSSQKALALPPGMSFVMLSPKAEQRVRSAPRRSFYFDFKSHLDNLPRGQTPFTPAVGVLGQLERRLERLLQRGVGVEIDGVRALALDVRGKIHGLPLRVFPVCPSNAVTALELSGGMAPAWLVGRLAAEFGLFVCPNGGPLGDRIFRVGHLGDLTAADNTRLVAALRSLVPTPPPARPTPKKQ